MALAKVSRLGHVAPDSRRRRLASRARDIATARLVVGHRFLALAMLQLLDNLGLLLELLLELLNDRLKPRYSVVCGAIPSGADAVAVRRGKRRRARPRGSGARNRASAISMTPIDVPIRAVAVSPRSRRHRGLL